MSDGNSNGSNANGGGASLKAAEHVVFEILAGAQHDIEVFRIALDAGLNQHHMPTQRTRSMFAAYLRFHQAHPTSHVELPALALSYGLADDDARALSELVGCGSKAAELLAKEVIADFEQRDRKQREKMAAVALERGDTQDALALLAESMPATTQGQPAVGVIESWLKQGPLHRYASSIAGLDRACRGGLPNPWRTIIVGAPGAGKTAVAAVMAHHYAGFQCVGFHAIDEDADDIVTRLAQLEGFTLAEIEERAPVSLIAMGEQLEKLQLRLYSNDWTIERAAADLSRWSKSVGKRGMLFVDSLQTVRSERVSPDMSPREIVETNIGALRVVTDRYRIGLVATSEANRGSYRSNDHEQNELASGAESRAIEYGAQTLLFLRTPKDHADVIHVRIPKNRNGLKQEFWLALDRPTHQLIETKEPGADSEADRENHSQAVSARLEQLGQRITRIVVESPGIGDRAIRAALRAQGATATNAEVDAAKWRLSKTSTGHRLVNRGRPRMSAWYVETGIHEDKGES